MRDTYTISRDRYNLPTSPRDVRGMMQYDPETNGKAKGYEDALKEVVLPLAVEMHRFLIIIERAEADPEIWNKLTAGSGIATANAYRNAISKVVAP